MADNIVYRSSRSMSLPELEACLEKAFPGGKQEFQIADGDLYFERTYPALPELPDGARLGRVRVEGRLKTVEELEAEFDRLSKALAPHLGRWRHLGGTAIFELRGFQQNLRQAASFRLSLTGEPRVNVGFEPGGLGGGRKNVAALHDLFKRVESWGRFPFVFVDEGKSYRIEPKNGVKLRLGSSELRDRNPRGFSYPLSEPSVAEGFDLMKSFVLEFGSGRVFRTEWVASTDISQGDPGALEFYRRIRAGRFRAKSYSLFAVLRASNLEELEGARTLCRGKARLVCEIGSIPLKEDNYATVEVVARESGYLLQLNCRYPIDVAKLSSELGLELVESGLA